MNKYYIYVWWTKYEEYPLTTGYEIEAANREDAEATAKEKYSLIYGIELQDIKTRVPWTPVIQQEDLERYRECGLPDEIPS